jgi:hypothetical protein
LFHAQKYHEQNSWSLAQEGKRRTVGLKQWIARRTLTPISYADLFARHLLDLSNKMAAAVVAFSGDKPACDPVDTDDPFLFLTHFDMEQHGFEPVTKDIAQLIDPVPEEMHDYNLFGPAYRASTAFLWWHTYISARKTFRGARRMRTRFPGGSFRQ